MKDEKLICKICNREIKSYLGLSHHLIKFHKVKIKDYYDLYFKTENEEFCNNPNCNNKTSFGNIRLGYARFCSVSCGLKSFYSIPENIERASNLVKEFYINNPEKREEVGIKTKENWENDQYREKVINSRIESWANDDERKEKQSELFKKLWKEEEFREKTIKGMKEYFIKNPEELEKRRDYMLSGGAAYLNSFIKNPSENQVEIFNIVKTIYSNAILNYPILELNYALDVAIPHLKICIEYDEIYHLYIKDEDLERQRKIESLGWKFIRYFNYIPSKDKIIEDISKLLI